MHDDVLERRLRTALHDRADSLSFTITAAELERRAVLRGRGAGNRRLMWLLAAAVAVGALGAGGILGGLANNPTPTPSAPAIAMPSDALVTTNPPSSKLPSLDELIAADPSSVLVAGAHGPSDGPGVAVAGIDRATSYVSLGDVAGRGAYRISAACFGERSLLVSVRPAGASGAIVGPEIPCGGSVAEQTIQIDGPASVVLGYVAPTSWRVVIRGEPHLLQPPTADPMLPPAPDGAEELVRLEDQLVESGAAPWDGSAMGIQEVGVVPARRTYTAQLWCQPGASMRLVFGDFLEGVLTADTETHVVCDGLVHEQSLEIPQPNGSRVFVAAPPSAHWSLLVMSAEPPIALTREAPGWQLTMGYGPSLSISDEPLGVAITAGDPDGDRVMVVLVCTGSEPIEVSVDVGDAIGDRVETFLADCAPGGAETSRAFEVAGDAHVSYEAPPWEWTALSVLVPAPKAAP